MSTLLTVCLVAFLSSAASFGISYSGDKAAAPFQIQLRMPGFSGPSFCTGVAVRKNCVLTASHCDAGHAEAWWQAFSDPTPQLSPPAGSIGNVVQSESLDFLAGDGVAVLRTNRNIVAPGNVATLATSALADGTSGTLYGNGLNELGVKHVSNAVFEQSFDYNATTGTPLISLLSKWQNGHYVEIQGGDSGSGLLVSGKVQGIAMTSGFRNNIPSMAAIDVGRHHAQVDAVIDRVCDQPLPAGNPISCTITTPQTTVSAGSPINFTLSGVGPIAYAIVTTPSPLGTSPGVLRIDPWRGTHQGSVSASAYFNTHLTANVYTANGLSSTCTTKPVSVPLPPTCTLTATPNEVQANAQVTLSLAGSFSVVSASIDGVNVALNANKAGSRVVTVAASKNYTATVTNAVGQTGSCSAAVTLAPPECELTVNPNPVVQNRPAILTLRVTKGQATTGTVEGSPVTLQNGIYTGSVPTDTVETFEYHARVKSPQGVLSNECSVRYTVQSPLPPSPQPPANPTACSGSRTFVFGPATSANLPLNCRLSGFTLSALSSCAPKLNLSSTVPASGIVPGTRSSEPGGNTTQPFNVNGSGAVHSQLNLFFQPNIQSCLITIMLR